MARDRTRRQHDQVRSVQVRPAVAKLRERVAKVATQETGPQQVRA